MSAPLKSIMKREALGQKRVANILSKLKSRLIDSTAMLRMVWKENPRELFSKNLDWFHDVAPYRACRPWIFFINGVLCFLKINGNRMKKEES